MAPFENFDKDEASEESDVDSSDSSDDEAMKQWELDQIKRGVRHASKGGSYREEVNISRLSIKSFEQHRFTDSGGSRAVAAGHDPDVEFLGAWSAEKGSTVPRDPTGVEAVMARHEEEMSRSQHELNDAESLLAKTERMLEQGEASFNALRFDYPLLQERVRRLEEVRADAIRLMKDPERNARELEAIEEEVRALMSERRADSAFPQDGDVINID